MLKPQLLGTHVSPPTIMRQDAKVREEKLFGEIATWKRHLQVEFAYT